MFEPTDKKCCTTCFVLKSIDDFYRCSGTLRGECKECVIKKNVQNQKKTKPWLNKRDPDRRRKYQRDYYANNKEKFAKYRSNFKQKHPNYYKEYHAL